MKQLIIRGIGTELHNAIKDEARRRGLSINRFVLAIIREAIGLGNGLRLSEKEFHDIDHLVGTWTQQEFEEFEKLLVLHRSIDEELWQ